MFIVLLKFAANKDLASQFTDGHKTWLQRGFEEGAFLLAGTLKPGLGGAILARSASREDLETRVKDDPFVAEGVVAAEILEWNPSQAAAPFSFLFD